ncbi:hypothetical protein DL764_006264 [Monosporascus ibericus]|uniref:RNA-dependent RNA polymerase n=1 Tax=Monosporascus ibericus TaxID=155417 RepID=A0A4Q4T7S9_9PEZI|nr:hypothetical protein DL764_006264 [Monosporascus ibericus]
MECHMRNLPKDLTDNSLSVQLQPLIRDLKITDWTCQKPRGKSYGNVTFLRYADGEKFLRQHSEIIVPGFTRKGQQRSRSRLTILNAHVYCSQSQKPPDTFLLRSLADSAEDRKLQDQAEPERHKAVLFKLLGLSCGHYEYPQGHATYFPDIQWSPNEIADGTIKFAKHMIIVTFHYADLGQIRLEIPYRTINEIVVSTRPPSFVLTLWEAPRIFQERNQDITALMGSMGLQNHYISSAQRTRLPEIPHYNGKHGEILGQTLVYFFEVSPEEFHYKTERLKDKQVLTLDHRNFPAIPLDYRPMYAAAGLEEFKAALASLPPTIPFDVRFQFQALVQNGYLLPQTVEQLLGILKKVSARRRGASSKPRSPCPISANAIKKLFSQIPFPGLETEASEFILGELWSYIEANENEVRQGLVSELSSERARQNLVMVYKVQVTPTRILLQGPEPEAKNRILRKFPNHTQYFARVQFCEEDGQDLFFNSKVSLDQIWSRFKTVLLKGLAIAGRQYDFLGFSHSSLRAHAAWFMAPFVDEDGQLQSYFTVISRLGRFTHITSPARCAARIGQAFSETPFSIPLKDLGVKVEFIDDVERKGETGTRVFSDGVGTVSRDLMKEIQRALPQKKTPPTCIQIRWAGAKGMLALDDALEGMVMRIRPSMVKFESPDQENLEICDIANKPIPLVLNRQMIKVLEDMGCSEEWFFKIQNRELNRLRMITASVDNTVVFLKRQKVADQIRFSQLIRRLHILGIDYKRDQFLCSVVETVVLRELRLLKNKARIPVEKGVTLFGIVDEYGLLEEDEIFLTFDGLPGTHYRDLDNRQVLVTRSPALHPGDIQIRRAVVPPNGHPLLSLSNCVVFSQKGERDLPSQLSGGDLDGDIYNIIWDDFAVSSCKREFAPADYPRVPPLDIRRSVVREDMTDFFVHFMATDQLGLIAIKHMILADQKAAGTVAEECRKLAELHSTAVDYSKTGIPVGEGEFQKLGNTRYRPDFLAPAPLAELKDRNEIIFDAPIIPAINDDEDDNMGPQYHFYKSDKILGKLYRAIDEQRIWKEDIRRPKNKFGPSLWDELLLYVNEECEELGGIDWESALQEARGIRHAYDDAIRGATRDYSEHVSVPISEVEVFTGCIFTKSGTQTRRQRDKSIRLKDEFDRIAKWTESVIRKQKIESRGDDDADDDDERHTEAGVSDLELSVACLHVGCAPSRGIAGSRTGEVFQSFKVIAASCALRELDFAIKRQEIAAGAGVMGGGYVGVNGRY